MSPDSWYCFVQYDKFNPTWQPAVSFYFFNSKLTPPSCGRHWLLHSPWFEKRQLPSSVFCPTSDMLLLQPTRLRFTTGDPNDTRHSILSPPYHLCWTGPQNHIKLTLMSELCIITKNVCVTVRTTLVTPVEAKTLFVFLTSFALKKQPHLSSFCFIKHFPFL